MIGLLQRVTQARVTVEENIVGEIGRGLLVLVGVERDDTEIQAERLLKRLLAYRVFPDSEGKMNRSLCDLARDDENTGLLLVPQFTLAADTQKGLRPSFSSAATPEKARRLFDYLHLQAAHAHRLVACGHFGVDMQVALINDGPVTFWLQAN